MCFHGAIAMFFFISAITTFVVGAIGLNAISKGATKMEFDIFTYTLPFVAFILDHSTKKIKNLQEKSIFVLIKLIIIVYYLGAYVLALQQLNSTKFFIIAQVNFLIYPFFSTFYGYLLRKSKLA